MTETAIGGPIGRISRPSVALLWIGVTRGGNWMCHPYFRLKKLATFFKSSLQRDEWWPVFFDIVNFFHSGLTPGHLTDSRTTYEKEFLIRYARENLLLISSPTPKTLLFVWKSPRFFAQNWNQCIFCLFLPKFGCYGNSLSSLKISDSICRPRLMSH